MLTFIWLPGEVRSRCDSRLTDAMAAQIKASAL